MRADEARTAVCWRSLRKTHCTLFDTFFQLGWHHLTDAGAWDHQLFLATIALAYPPVLWRRWLWLATLFALAHTLALILLSAGVVPLHLSWVEPAVAASIVVLAAVDAYFLVVNPLSVSNGRRWYSNPKALLILGLVLIFGVVHGLAFGNSFVPLVASGLSTVETTTALFAFTCGVEAGQLVILLVMWVVAFVLFDLLQLWPRYLRLVLIVGVAGAGLIALANTLL